VNALYICEESRPTLPNTGTLSAGWAAPVIALLYTLSTHHHPILLSKLFLTTLLSELVLLLSLLKAFYKASILFLLMHDTPTREVISSPFNASISFTEWQRSK
jgi:hypothetical protein